MDCLAPDDSLAEIPSDLPWKMKGQEEERGGVSSNCFFQEDVDDY
jgi:hypothetical protein